MVSLCSVNIVAVIYYLNEQRFLSYVKRKWVKLHLCLCAMRERYQRNISTSSICMWLRKWFNLALKLFFTILWSRVCIWRQYFSVRLCKGQFKYNIWICALKQEVKCFVAFTEFNARIRNKWEESLFSKVCVRQTAPRLINELKQP